MNEEILENISNMITELYYNKNISFLKAYSEFLESSTFDKLIEGSISIQNIKSVYAKEKGLTIN